MKEKVITAKIQRFNPRSDDSPRFQEYKVEADESMSVLGLIKHIHDNIDRTLAYRNVSCYLGVCTACLMNINGKKARACSTIVSPGDELTIRPIKEGHDIIRDLVVDLSK